MGSQEDTGGAQRCFTGPMTRSLGKAQSKGQQGHEESAWAWLLVGIRRLLKGCKIFQLKKTRGAD